MKALCFLFSIWIVFCTGTPCADGHTHASGEETGVLVHLPITEHEAGTDLCSPFCACYCCAVTTALPAATTFVSRPQPLAVIADSYLCPPAYDFTGAPWQPPRFS